MKSFVSTAAIVLFFFCGFMVSFWTKEFPLEATEYDGMMSTRRDPAAIKRVYDFSHLEGSALSYATKNRLLSGAKSISNGSSVGLELGHFVISAEDGSRVFACDRFKNLTMIFQGDGSAVAGNPPAMEVEGECRLGKDVNSIAALMIPVQKILGESVADGDFDFRESHAVKVRFAHVADQWPTVWKLVGIRLSNSDDPGQAVLVSPEEIDQFHREPVLIDFMSR